LVRLFSNHLNPNKITGSIMNTYKYPVRKKVSAVVSGRYDSGKKPVSWDERIAGLDIVVDESGDEISLYSSGDQSTPAPGWELLLTGASDQGGSTWTLYGIAKI
jgi:hypothetical protein